MSFPEAEYFVGGLVVGGIYAIFVLGLVLTYKSSRVFNFSHGAIAYFVATTYNTLIGKYEWSIVPAALVSIFVVAPLIGLILWAVLFRQLTHASPTVRLVATIGLLVAITPATTIIWGERPFTKAAGLAPEPISVWHPFGVGINANQVAVLAAAVAIALGLTLLLRFTTFGLQVRGSVDSPVVAGLTGTNTALVSAVSWMIGTTTAGLAGVLLAPILGLSNFTLLLIASFAAVVIARMTSLPLAFAGAIALGLAQEIAVKYLPEDGVLSTGFRPSLPFLVMAVFLLAYRSLGREQYAIARMPSTRHRASSIEHAPLWRKLVGPLFVVGALFLLPTLVSDFWLGVIGTGTALGIIFLSQTIVTGEGGMISLCQVTFAGIGAIASAQLITVHGWDPIPGVLTGAAFAVPFGIAVAVPVLRLGGLYVALATLAFGVLVEQLLFPIQRFANFGSGVDLFRPTVFPGLLGEYADLLEDRNYYYAMFVVFVMCALAVVSLRRSTFGLKLAATRMSEPAAATLGINIARTKVAAFAVSAFLAGLGGTLFAMSAYRAVPDNFNVIIGLLWFAIVVTWGVRSVVGALLGGVAISVMPQLITQHLPAGSWKQVPTLLFGLGAIAVAREPRGVVVQTVEGFRRLGHLVLGRGAGPDEADVEGTPGTVPA